MTGSRGGGPEGHAGSSAGRHQDGGARGTIAESAAAALGATRDYRTVQTLRFVAAFAVVCFHACYFTHERLAPGFGIYEAGANGVRLFFVISGFVMVLSSERLAGRPRGWAVFAVRRILRIVPLYWLVMAVKVALLLVTSGIARHPQLDPVYIAKSFLFIPAVSAAGLIQPIHGVGWTLNFEMFFYASFTLALALRVAPIRFIAPLLVALAAASPFRTPDWPVPLMFYADPVVLDFLAGMLVAHGCRRGLAIGSLWGAALAAGGLLGLFLPLDLSMLPELPRSLLVTTFAVSTLVGATALEPRIGAALPRWAVFMGAASYALYLIHPLVAPAAPFLLARLGGGAALAWPGFAGAVAVACVAGVLVYRFVETPISRALDARLRGSRPMGADHPVGGPRPEEATDPAQRPIAP